METTGAAFIQAETSTTNQQVLAIFDRFLTLFVA